ncbi:MAG: sigma-70 family RNA polymerase sigma factor [Gammaproteobacteria bacterium]|nr:MAG: sigma-70 family RNA polymerase sigma factor [Gammaproteobacteria bacterium]
MGKLSKQFDALVGALSPELYRYAMGLCHNPDVAQDLVQETFLRAWRSQETLRDVKTARAWLYTILRHEHARLYERQRPDVRDPHELPDVPVRGYDTSTEAFTLRRALQRLEPQYREPLMLQVVGGFSCKEIGNMLGLKPNTVLTRVFRARKMLHAMLGEDKQETAHEMP